MGWKESKGDAGVAEACDGEPKPQREGEWMKLEIDWKEKPAEMAGDGGVGAVETRSSSPKLSSEEQRQNEYTHSVHV